MENYGNILYNAQANSILYDIDDRDNIYISYVYKNRLEKYDANGKLVFRADHRLGYPETKIESKSLSEAMSERKISLYLNQFSDSMALDSKGNIWVLTLNRQMKESEENKTDMFGNPVANKAQDIEDITRTEMYDLEIYDTEGILLGRIGLDFFADVIEIAGERLYIIDKEKGMCCYVYEIIGK